jgi:hypothetical protein
VEPLIDPATFQRIQEALRANQRRTQGHPKRDYLLRGLLKCKHCGKSISGLYNRKSYRRKDGSLWKGGSRHYVCNGYQNHHDTALPQRCVLRSINADLLEAAIWAEVEKVLTNPGFLRQALTMNVEETLERLPQLEAQAAHLQEQITDAEKKERRALELALSLNDISMDTLKGMVTEIQQAKRGWQEERDRLTWRMAELTATSIACAMLMSRSMPSLHPSAPICMIKIRGLFWSSSSSVFGSSMMGAKVDTPQKLKACYLRTVWYRRCLLLSQRKRR